MTNEQEKARELAKLLTAFANGKRLQYKIIIANDRGFDWRDFSGTYNQLLCKIIDQIQVRIKPEPKRIALNQQDLIDRELSGKTMRVKHGIACMLIQDFNDELVFFSDDEFSYEQLTSLEWIDNTPCYKEVECE